MLSTAQAMKELDAAQARYIECKLPKIRSASLVIWKNELPCAKHPHIFLSSEMFHLFLIDSSDSNTIFNIPIGLSQPIQLCQILLRLRGDNWKGS